MFKNPRKNFIKISLLIFIIYFIYPSLVYAETRINQEDIKENSTWDKAGSPYVLQDYIYIPDDYRLNIKEGVEVISTTTQGDPFTITVDGNLYVFGTKDSPVKFNNLYSLYLISSNSYISNALFIKTGLDFINSTSSIEFTTIKDSFNGINAESSRINISTSTIINNTYGIFSKPHQKVFQSRMTSSIDTGGIGNALDGITLDKDQNILFINDSSIYGNTNYQIINQTLNTVDATDNWWGRSSGPNENDTNGLVAIDPWKIKDPNIKEEVCCSSVLFIPGIEASRLYKDTFRLLGTSTNTLWEPNRNEDVRKLYMDSDGISLDKGIYTKDIIDTALGIKNIYKSFIKSMDSLVIDGSINKWLPFPYDWRKGVYDIIDNSFLESVYDLASTSKTKKLVIVAHSNGGLVTKALMKKLESLGGGDIVENIIFIAVPELGTPEAILSMLHGHNQSLGGGIILSEKKARIFSQNIPGAYGLLPSKKFFDKNPLTVISDFFKNNIEISSFDSMKDFIINNSFSKKSSSNIDIPLLLKDNLFTKNTLFHSSIDDWKPASTIKFISILGWGLSTSQGIEYKKDIHCKDNLINNCKINKFPIFTKSGDGTIITKSNAESSNSKIFFNLKEIKNDGKGNINHANVLESLDLITKIKDIIINKKSSTTNPPEYEKYFSSIEPVDSSTDLVIKIFSPVDIDIYDKEGRHTGLIENPKYDSFENEIPGGYYSELGSNKIVAIPYSQDYKIILKGNDTGVFIIQAEVRQFEKVIASTTFSELPVMPTTNIEFIIPKSIEDFASSTVMNIDVDGNGTIDMIGHTDIFLNNATSTSVIKDLQTYIESIRLMILSLKLSSNIEKRWLYRLDKITTVLENKNFKKVDRFSKKLSNKIFKNRKLTEIQKKEMLNILDDLILDIETYYISKIDSKGKL